MIDAGTSNNAPLVDFDNISRPVGAGFDIGAYEFTPSSVASPTANAGPDQTFTAGTSGTAVGHADRRGQRTRRERAHLSMDRRRHPACDDGIVHAHLLDRRASAHVQSHRSIRSVRNRHGVDWRGTRRRRRHAWSAGNSVTMTPDTTVCTTGGVKLTIVDSVGTPVGAPQYVCSGATGCNRCNRCNGCNGCAGGRWRYGGDRCARTSWTGGTCGAARRLQRGRDR